jgi:hypothetical protein
MRPLDTQRQYRQVLSGHRHNKSHSIFRALASYGGRPGDSSERPFKVTNFQYPVVFVPLLGV